MSSKTSIPVKEPRGGTDEHGNVLAFVVTDEQRLMRMLILGSEGATFYVTAQDVKRENVTCVLRMITDGQGEKVVETLVDVVKNGRCIKMNIALFVLAICCRSQDAKTKTAAYRAILDVCNIPTHLFKFIQYIESYQPDLAKKTTGWGRGLRKALSLWYNKFATNPQRLAMLVTKYRQREGWSHRDLLRLTHLKPIDSTVGYILRYIVKGVDEAKKYYLEDGLLEQEGPQLAKIVKYLDAVEEVRSLDVTKGKKGKKIMEEEEESMAGLDDAVIERVVALVQEFDLLREHLPSAALNFAPVWQCMLEKMPMMALYRNLNKITKLGLLQNPENLHKVLAKLNNREALKKSKVHPYAILTALYTYSKGKGFKGNLFWDPVPEVVVAMEKAFYAAFPNVQPTNKRILLALDVSSSMESYGVENSPLSPLQISAAMSLVTLNVEPNVDMMAFSDALVPLELDKHTTLTKAVDSLSRMAFGGTDCSLPMVWALENKKEYDVFVIYTDSETWSSRITPAQALRDYRKKMGIPTARLAVVATTGMNYSLADPQDIYMLDISGFDTDTPTMLREFMAGTFAE